MTNTATYHALFTQSELIKIQALEAGQLKKGIRYKIDPGTNSGVIHRTGHTITGYMTVDCFGGNEIESAAIANSDTDWEKMLDVLMDYAKEKEVRRILFIADPNDTLVTEKLHGLGLSPLFAEYRMVFNATNYAPAAVKNIGLRNAADSDRGYIMKLDEEAFENAQPITPADLDRTCIIINNGLPAGKLRIDGTDGVYGIYGIIVEKHLRGQGIGGQALTLALNNLINLNAKQIYLEVDSENPAAFHLYQKLGFQVQSEFRYYPYCF